MENSNLEKLLAAMHFEPTKWEYRGEIVDHGNDHTMRCACGHHIRWEFPIYEKETSERLPIGSTCIEFNPWMPKEIVDAYRAAWNKKTEEERQAELLRQEILVGVLKSNFEHNKEVLKAIVMKRFDLARAMYPTTNYYRNPEQYNFCKKIADVWNRSVKVQKGKLKTPKGWIRRYEKITEEMKKVNSEFNLAMELFG